MSKNDKTRATTWIGLVLCWIASVGLPNRLNAIDSTWNGHVAATTPSSTQQLAWQQTVRESKDELTGRTTGYQIVGPRARPTKRMSWLFGSVTAQIGAACRKSSAPDIRIAIAFSEEPILINSDNPRVGYSVSSNRVAFDGNDPIRVTFTQKWGSNYLSSDDQRLIDGIAAQNMMRLELDWYGDGLVVFPFNLSGSTKALETLSAACTVAREATSGANDSSRTPTTPRTTSSVDREATSEANDSASATMGESRRRLVATVLARLNDSALATMGEGHRDSAATEAGPAEEETDISAAPTFTPYTVKPGLKNEREVQRALEREYPPLLRDAGIGGTVRVHFFITEEGVVQDTRIDQSSGHSALDEAALRVADFFEFTPALNRDKKVPVWISLPITFTTT